MTLLSEAGWSGPAPGPDPEPSTAPAAPRRPRGSAPSLEGERYEWRDELGRGGMGEVHAVFDARLGREVALKLLEPGDRRAAARVAREAEVAARLEHPAIVPVYDAGVTARGRSFFTMRLVRGRSLALAIHEAHTLEARLALLRPLLTVAEALAYAHSRGVIHRDLKPANVMLGAFGEVQVVDWGLAAVGGERDAFAGVGVGTRGFASPEQLEGAEADPRADVHGLGASLRSIVDGVAAPEDLLAIVEKACARAAADRYEGPEPFAEDLRRFLDGRPVRARTYSSWDLAKRFVRAYRRLLGLLLAGLLTATVIFALAYGRVDDARTRAESAERETREVLVEQSRTYGWALERQALAELASGAAAEAEILSAHALATRDSPRARGILMRAHAGPRLRVQRTRVTADCSRVHFGARAYVCEREGMITFHADGEAAPRWSVAFDTNTIAFGRDNLLLLASSEASLRDRTTGKEIARLTGLYPSNGPAVSPSGELGAKFGPVLVARSDDGRLRRYAPCATGRTTALAFGDEHVAGACTHGVVSLMSRRVMEPLEGSQEGLEARIDGTTQPIRALAVPFARGRALGPAFSMAFDEGDRRLALGSVDGYLALLDVARGTIEGPWKLSDRALSSLAFLDGRNLLVSTDGGAGLVFDTATGLARFAFPERLSARLRASDGVLFASVGANRWSWELPADAPPATLTAPAGLSSAAFDARGEWVALARGDGAVSVRDLAEGSLLGEPHIGDAVVKRVAASRDGSSMFAAMAADPGFFGVDLDSMTRVAPEGLPGPFALKRLAT
ncbi:MAG: WD40 repeat domain-containing serine/threonine protein kinase, partial [Myxococcota bacterium]